MLTLTVARYQQTPFAEPATKRFNRTGGTIGRDLDNDWVLNDPNKFVSSHHCRISYRDGQYEITDTSRNGVYLNTVKRPIGKGNMAVLHDGDNLIIGDFEVEVNITDDRACSPMPNPNPSPEPDPTPLPPADVLLQAFVAGAGGARLDLRGQDPVEAMHRAGAILLAAVEGLFQLLETRSEMLRAFHIPRTMIQAAGNSQFKVLSRPEDVLSAMLGPPQSNYLPAIDAVHQGFDDIKAHEFATCAAMQAALAKLLGAFDPEVLKKQLEHGSVLDAILPSNRDAKYWKLYSILYSQSIGGLFWREFARTYEEQVKNSDRIGLNGAGHEDRL
jgi:type VI secretion system protein ImpI